MPRVAGGDEPPSVLSDNFQTRPSGQVFAFTRSCQTTAVVILP